MEARVDEEFPVLGKAIEISGVERVDLLLRLLDCRAGLQFGDVLPTVAVALVVGLLLRSERKGAPKADLLLVVEKRECPRHHPDDGVGLAIEPHVAANNLRIAAKRTLPEPIAEHDPMLVPDLAFGVHECSAKRGGDTERAEEGRRDLHYEHARGGAA
jgi:hypothetical protein